MGKFIYSDTKAISVPITTAECNVCGKTESIEGYGKKDHDKAWAEFEAKGWTFVDDITRCPEHKDYELPKITCPFCGALMDVEDSDGDYSAECTRCDAFSPSSETILGLVEYATNQHVAPGGSEIACCPWCGNDVGTRETVEFEYDRDDTWACVVCDKCHAWGESGDDEEEAIEKWNKRI